MTVIASEKHNYVLGKLVGESPTYRLYLCVQEDTGRECLLQVATDATHNGTLDRVAFLLGELKAKSDELEAEYATVRTDEKDMLNYDLGFPILVESFVFHAQGERRINILAFKGVTDMSRVVPCRNIILKDRQRVYIRTSGWIMGKLLKLLVFAHSSHIAVESLDDTSILLEPSQHYVVLFDWSKATLYPESDVVPEEQRRAEIARAAQVVIALLAGNSVTRVFPDSEGFELYTDYLVELANGGECDAMRAHTAFYKLVQAHFPRGFYPFTSCNR